MQDLVATFDRGRDLVPLALDIGAVGVELGIEVMDESSLAKGQAGSLGFAERIDSTSGDLIDQDNHRLWRGYRDSARRVKEEGLALSLAGT